MSELFYLDLGQAAYEPTLQLQQRLVAEVLEAQPERAYLLLVEHNPPVITLGRSAKAWHVLASKKELARQGIELSEASRGGDVTYHGPGQLVAYPIFRLDLHDLSPRSYLRALERVAIRVLGELGIQGRQVKGLTGVWVGDEKVAAIGVAVRRWVCYHGLALNVQPNLAHFDLIVPCGIADKRVTSIARVLGHPVSVSRVKPILVKCMVEELGFDGARQERL